MNSYKNSLLFEWNLTQLIPKISRKVDLGPVKCLQIFFAKISNGSKPSTTLTKSFF